MEDAAGDHVEEHARAFEATDDKTKARARDRDKDKEKSPPGRVEKEPSHLDPSRWWFASAAFPMIAGTLGPVASAFSILALVQPWRQLFVDVSLPDEAPFIPDPGWLTAINAVQLFIAIGANLALLLNMTRRLRFSIAQPVTIVGWYISSICLVALTATASGPLVIEPADEYIWSQAFFYGIYSAILYFLVASLMTMTFMGAQMGRYPKDFMLTPSQRTLMLQTISFIMYLLLGALVFCNIESWGYLDAVYWAAVTLFTVGFGDIYPETILGRALLFPYALVGIISLGLVIGSIRSLVLERGKHRLDARMVEKKRRRLLRSLAMKGKDDILSPIREPPGFLSSPPSIGPGSSVTTGLTEFERRGEEFKLMRKIQHDAERRRRWYAMAISGSTWLVLWLLGAKIFQEFEGPYQQWDYFTAVYFAFVSLTTVGYGDVTPVSNAAKSFWVFWALLALPTTTILISNAGDTIVKGIRDTTDQIAMITILPGERGFRKDLKQVLRMLSFGRLFQEEIEEAPPGFLGDARRISDEEEDEEEDGGNDVEQVTEQDQNELEAEGLAGDTARANQARDAESVRSFIRPGPRRSVKSDDSTASLPRTEAARSTSAQLLRMTRAVSLPRQSLPPIPTTPAEYHLTLIEEIGRVTRHLKAHPPRKYTFQEWAWYLSLVGEDENDADRHHKAHAHRRGEKEKHTENRDGKWSWVGSRSPLMSSQEEAEWILDKLTIKLERELKRAVRGERRASVK
ncbi:hypothetical protein B0T22DRAFT_373978 [Podospora appendiculata]|uniref:Potassium channel domain-containing protein n=1 Tax=Podospora appendiculata TaxID=314037 RepID=A0AAE0XFM3_9PEZI|nr:hypothetical protein B0T22DRAFT_373978 [Podospora appendiculata]